VKHLRTPTPAPPEEIVDDGPPGIPLDERGAPDLTELVPRWGAYDHVPSENLARVRRSGEALGTNSDAIDSRDEPSPLQARRSF
jgi:hypothetical protein